MVFKKTKRFGFSLLEIAMVLAVSMLMMGSYMYMSNQNERRISDKDVADHLNYVANAVDNYMHANRDKLLYYVPLNGTYYIPTARQSQGDAVPSASSQLPGLQEGGYLPLSFVDTDRFGLHTGIVFRQPERGLIEAMVISTGVEHLTSTDAGNIVRFMGLRGGVIMGNNQNEAMSIGSNKSNKIYGDDGMWSYQASDFSASGYTPSVNYPVALVTSYPDAMAANNINRYSTGIYDTSTMYKNLHMPDHSIHNVLADQTANLTSQYDPDSDDSVVRFNQNVETSGNMSIGHDLNGNTFNLQTYDDGGGSQDTFPDIDQGSNPDLDFRTGRVQGIRTWDAYSNGTVLTGNSDSGSVKTLFGGSGGNIQASSLISAGIMRPTYTATMGDDCNGVPIKSLRLSPDGNDTQSDVDASINGSTPTTQIGDIAMSSDGSWLSCQNLTDSSGQTVQKWASVKNPFSDFIGCQSIKDSYTNETDSVQFVTIQSNFQNVETNGEESADIDGIGTHEVKHTVQTAICTKHCHGNTWCNNEIPHSDGGGAAGYKHCHGSYSVSWYTKEPIVAPIAHDVITDSHVRFTINLGLFKIHWTSWYKIGNTFTQAAMVPPHARIYNPGGSANSAVKVCRWE